MHPLLADKRQLAAYLLAWIPVALVLASLLRADGAHAWPQAAAISAALAIVYAFVCLAPWYLCRLMPLRPAAIAQLFTVHVAGAAIAGALWAALAWALATLTHVQLQIIFGAGMALYLVFVALHYMVIVAQSSRRAEILAREAELKALKTQINPHFLFNSLHSISALTAADPAHAREMCIRLGDFLRRTLGLGEKQEIALREEFALIRGYLDIEQVRFGSRLVVEASVSEACADTPVPPLILQPLVENAVKHGIAGLLEGGAVRVSAGPSHGGVLIRIENPFDPASLPPSRTGVGLLNVRKRLSARYGDAARMRVHADGGIYRVELLIPE